MDKQSVVNALLTEATINPWQEQGQAFAPANIALVKYWGKQDSELNRPTSSSLSIALGNKGATTTIRQSHTGADAYRLNGQGVDKKSLFAQRLTDYLQLFRPSADFYFEVETTSSIAVAAGLASSASGFAALALALDDFFAWQLPKRALSILARLGSGSAARSLWPGFVLWHAGERADGMDSYAEPLDVSWPELRLGILSMGEGEKSISSRAGMIHTQKTSPFFSRWPQTVAEDLLTLQTALALKDFHRFGQVAEDNAAAMHALMASARPAIDYSTAATRAAVTQVRACRAEGIPVYYTQDAGPHLKLLFLEPSGPALQAIFPTMDLVAI